jgi:hypothetical protein
MRSYIVVLGGALALAACSSGGGQNNSADVNAAGDPNAQNMAVTEDNAALANGAGGMDMNTSTNAATENAMAKDLNTNDKETNLSNGM